MKNNKEKITKLKIMNKIKDVMIIDLMAIITKEKIILPENLREHINMFYGGGKNEARKND